MSLVDEKLISKMKSWRTGKYLFYCLGADVGGSGIRFRISNFNDETQFVEHTHIGANCAADIYQAVDSLDHCIKVLHPNSYCRGSAFAIAGLRKSKNSVCLFNWPGPDSNRTIDVSKFPKTLYPDHHSILLNDLEAGAYGIISCSKQGLTNQYFEKLWGPNKPLMASTNTIVMAMGSGLGAALITHERIRHAPIVIPTEMGYLQASIGGDKYPFIKTERDVINSTANYYYKGVQMPVYEDLASGRGIVVCYNHLLKKNNLSQQKNITASKITDLAKNGDKIALEAMKYHYIFFIRCAKAAASSLKCESVVMALSNQVSNRWFVKSIIPQMKAEFTNFTRPEWIERIAVWSQKKDLNFNNLGTSYVAKFVADYRL